ncbi:MAG TPA: serine/threonine-protein kinase [Kofleriaceae bacterium]|nr:serine/threonine-protein kinase [Kofleriaceae bacterium]
MNCPSCNSPLEQNARFCGVCGYRLQARAPAGQPGAQGNQQVPATARSPNAPASPRAPSPPIAVQSGRGQSLPAAAIAASPKPGARPKARPKGDEIYINAVLNNRFRVESKIGEGGFGAVYRGVQLATGRKVALKLLHPEMTKDENLVARFRREGMVLCNLRDAHTITTYDFDQTPDGTLYIAMELLEGKSLHQIFHEQAPLEWKRMFKILGEMCSSLAEAHAQGIVHRDLKPENVYLENRPGNPEFVKILDFGIAKVMRGDTIDPQSPQLTATGQTLGTLEYMSPEQLMGKQLDGRSDVYALGVVAYEMTTGRLPFPDAKGPAGLITAQLKQTPIPPSQANPKAGLPPAADRVILKCLEKDKNNRWPDVTQLANALQEVVAHAGDGFSQSAPAAAPQSTMPAHMLDTHRDNPPPMATNAARAPRRDVTPNPPAVHASPIPQPNPYPPMPMAQAAPMNQMMPYPGNQAGISYPHVPQAPQQAEARGISMKWIWWVVGLLALGAAAGAVLAFMLR